MTAREKGELILMVLATAGVAALHERLPSRMNSGDLVIVASVVLLGQGLVRDLWIKFTTTRPRVESLETKAARGPICMCVESTIGVIGVVAGILLIFAGSATKVTLQAWSWPMLTGGVLITGFLIKDYVLDWRTRSIRREKDHQHIVFW